MKKHAFRGAAILVLVSTIFLFSCKTTSAVETEEEFIPDENDYVSLTVPSSARTYFGSVNQTAVALVENGSPESLRQAFSVLHQSDRENYSERELLLLFCAYKIMKIVWPSENIPYEQPECTKNNPYYGAIHSVERGIFDTSTGNTDYLSTILPTLVLLTSGVKAEYIPDVQNALDTVLSVNKRSVLANYLYGKFLMFQGHAEKSLSYFETAMAQSPQNLELRSAYALSLYANGQIDDALDFAGGVLQVQSQNAEMLKIAARASYQKGLRDEAHAYVLRVLEVQPENSEFILFRAKILIDEEDFIRASSLLDAYARSDQNAKDYLLLRSRIALEWNKNSSTAADFIGTAVTLYPQDKEVLLAAASIASSMNTLVGGRSAIDLANEVLSLDTECIQAVDICIDEMRKLNLWQDAYELSSIVIANENASVEEKCSHVDICLTLGNTKEAQRLAESLYSAAPENEEVLRTYIKMLVGTSQKKKADSLISAQMEKANSKMKSFLWYEKSLLDSGENLVLEDLRNSLSANPRNRDALYRLYQIYYGKKEWKRAQYYLKQLVSLEPANTTLISLNAELDLLQGK